MAKNKSIIFLSRSKQIYIPEIRTGIFHLLDLNNLRNEEIQEALQLLDDQSLERAQKFIFKEDRNRYILAHAALRFYLGNFLNKIPSKIEILRTSSGKPYLKDFPLHFNISHTKRYAFLAFHSDCPIGVDIEIIQEDLDFLKIADLFMHPREKRIMIEFKNSCDYFFTLWSAKEALLKAIDINFNGLRDIYLQKSSQSNELKYKKNTIYTSNSKVDAHMLAICSRVI